MTIHGVCAALAVVLVAYQLWRVVLEWIADDQQQKELR